MKLAEFVRAARLSLNMTQKQVAVKIGTTVVFVNLIENGRSKIPLDKLKMLIKILKLSKNDVIELALNDYEERLFRELL